MRPAYNKSQQGEFTLNIVSFGEYNPCLDNNINTNCQLQCIKKQC